MTANIEAWERIGLRPETAPTDVSDIAYGPDASEAQLRLLGDVKGKRVLELGSGSGASAVALARRGASVFAVDAAASQLAQGRRLAEREEVRVEWHRSDLADLAFLRADSIDLVFSAYALGYVDDLGRVFRQVHRVLKPDAPLVFSVPHPAYDMIDDDDPEEPLLVRRSYFDQTPIDYEWNGIGFTDYHHSISDLFMGLTRTSFRVDTILEPEPLMKGPRSQHWREAFRMVPRTLIVRARKEGN